MEVKLLNITPKWLIVSGIRKCWDSQDRMDTDIETDILGPNDLKLIKTTRENGHLSTFEHGSLVFDVSGVSRALLQEMARHRIGVSPSVQSTRYTLKKILKGEAKVEDFLVKTGNEYIDALNIEHMTKLKALANTFDIPNDKLKYGIVEAYQVTYQVTFNTRSLRHFLGLRKTPFALWEIRQLSEVICSKIPEDHHVFYEDLL